MEHFIYTYVTCLAERIQEIRYVTLIMIICGKLQGVPSGCELPFVDIETKVPLQSEWYEGAVAFE